MCQGIDAQSEGKSEALLFYLLFWSVDGHVIRRYWHYAGGMFVNCDSCIFQYTRTTIISVFTVGFFLNSDGIFIHDICLLNLDPCTLFDHIITV